MPYFEIHQKDDDKQTLIQFVEKNFTKDETRKVSLICECFEHEYRIEMQKHFDFFGQRAYKDGIRIFDVSQLGFYNAIDMIIKYIISPNTNNITIKITNDENMD